MTQKIPIEPVIENLIDIVLKIYNKNCNKFKNCGVENNSSVECKKPYLDCFLLKNNLHEQAITHRIAHLLANKLKTVLKKKNMSIDCEYNRHRNEPKICNTENRKKILNVVNNTTEDEDLMRNICKLFRPDIIIHKRGEDSLNILIIEVKKAKCENDQVLQQDFVKLKNTIAEYNYKIGVSIALTKTYPIFTFFINETIQENICNLLKDYDSENCKICIYDNQHENAKHIKDYVTNRGFNSEE